MSLKIETYFVIKKANMYLNETSCRRGRSHWINQFYSLITILLDYLWMKEEFVNETNNVHLNTDKNIVDKK